MQSAWMVKKTFSKRLKTNKFAAWKWTLYQFKIFSKTKFCYSTELKQFASKDLKLTLCCISLSFSFQVNLTLRCFKGTWPKALSQRITFVQEYIHLISLKKFGLLKLRLCVSPLFDWFFSLQIRTHDHIIFVLFVWNSITR